MKALIKLFESASWSGPLLQHMPEHTFSYETAQLIPYLPKIFGHFFSILLISSYIYVIKVHFLSAVFRVASGPRVKLASCKIAFNRPAPPPVVNSTDRSKAVVLVLFLLFVALWFPHCFLFFFFFFFWFGFYGPFKNISLISSRSFIEGGRKPENPEKNHLTIRKQNLVFPHMTRARLEPQRWEIALLSVVFYMCCDASIVVTVFNSCPLCCFISCAVVLAFWSHSTAANFAFCFISCD